MVADLEATLQVRLLDRSTRGVASTVFGDVLLRRGRAALDELRQGMEEISFLSNQTTGEVRVGCPESISSAVLPRIANLFFRQYPRAVGASFKLTPAASPCWQMTRTGRP